MTSHKCQLDRSFTAVYLFQIALCCDLSFIISQEYIALSFHRHKLVSLEIVKNRNICLIRVQQIRCIYEFHYIVKLRRFLDTFKVHLR